MDHPQEIDDYLRESIEYSLGLPVSKRTLELKLRSSEEAQRHMRDQCFYLKSKLLEKDKTIDGARAESSMNAQAVKKFVEENQKLALECGNLLAWCTKWEKECSLYDHDVEALMEFGNEADERAKEAELRVRLLEDKLSKLLEELQSFKQQSESQKVGKVTDNESTEDHLVVTLLSTFINNDEVASTAHLFLEANSGVDVCQKMLKLWDSLKPSTRVVLSLASEVKRLQKDKEHLRINLTKAEEEVIVLCNENDILDNENRRLTYLLQKERQLQNSGGNLSSGSVEVQNHKRKSRPCPKEGSPVEKKIEFSDAGGSPRKPLSPLLHNK